MRQASRCSPILSNRQIDIDRGRNWTGVATSKRTDWRLEPTSANSAQHLSHGETARAVPGALLAPFVQALKAACAPNQEAIWRTFTELTARRIAEGQIRMRMIRGDARASGAGIAPALACPAARDGLCSALASLRSDAMHLALYQPDIPQNTGTILRLAACLGVEVQVIGPAGFSLSDRSLRRAGLDYLDALTWTLHDGFAAFEAWRAAHGARLVLLSTQATTPHVAFRFRPDDVLMVGRESAGVPQAVHASADARVLVPMRAGLRSLNVAVAAAIVLGEALRQTDGFPV
jgi:tRNA (cytidine/uridine-2'-O-)-methyltransferase